MADKLKTVEDLTEDMFFWMASMPPSVTGLPMTIWISPEVEGYMPGVKVQSNYYKKISSTKMFLITLEDDPKIIGNTGVIKQKDLFAALKFVKANLDVLREYHTGNIPNLVDIMEIFKTYSLNCAKDKSLEEFLKIEKDNYEINKEKFLKEYEGKYIALIDGTIIDHDLDYSALAKRVFEKNDYRPIYMPLVSRKEKICRIKTPKFQK